MEKVYVGTKIVKAEPMLRSSWVYQSSKGESKISSSDEKDGYRVTYEDGYVSWSPKDVFERCYRELTQQEKAMTTPQNPVTL
jgi:hypothetical protein